jgi:hypothetical protein
LAIAASGSAERSPRSSRGRSLLVERAGALDLGGALGHRELPVLHRAERAAEHLAGTQPLHGQVQRRLGDTDTGGADPDPAPDQGRQGDAQPRPPLAEQILGRHPDVVEHDVGGDLAPVTHLQVGRTDPDAGAGQVDQKHRGPVAAGPGAHQHRDPAGDDAVGDPALAPVENVAAVIGRLGDGLHPLRGEVRAGVGLGRGEGEGGAAAGQLGDQPGPQLVRGVGERLRDEDALAVVDARHRARVVGDLLGDRAGGQHRMHQTCAEVGPERDLEQALLGEPAEDLPREAVGGLLAGTDVTGVRGEPLLDRGARRRADRDDLLGQPDVVGHVVLRARHRGSGGLSLLGDRHGGSFLGRPTHTNSHC